MNNILIYVIILVIMYFFFFFFSVEMFYMNYSLMFEWLVFSMNSINLEVMILIDWMSLVFISFVCMISSMVMLYSMSYMDNSKFLDRFVYLVMLFILSMMIMIVSPNMFSILFGWDGLGVVSYCLVIYYHNYSSYNSGMVTVLCNRVGDVAILMLIGMMMMYGSWNLVMFSNISLMIFLMLIAGLTKSAQIPFSVWLPMAMAAPTPVSALVHSSTLVTAGVYLLIRFSKILVFSEMSKLLLFISVITMFMSGLMANVEFDLKKIIALSTLSQLGMMMMILSLGYSFISFYHLLTHAMFKSLLFLCAGVIIHMMNNNQDIRKMGNLNEVIPFTMMSFYLASFALSGFPFMSGFYSKDLIMEIIYFNNMNFFLFLMALMSLVFTVAYSLRLFYYLYFSEIKYLKIMGINEVGLMNFSMFFLMIMSVVSGSMLNWMFFYDFSFMFLNLDLKLLTLVMCLVGLFFGIYIYFKNLIKIYYLSVFFSSMWFLGYLYNYIYYPFLVLSEVISEVDLTWVEYSSKKFFLWLYMDKMFYGIYSINVFIVMFMGMVFILMMFMY